MKTVIIDYGVGNLTSIKNMLRKIGSEAIISSSEDQITEADRLILPGVGSFDYGMTQLHKLGLVEILDEKVIRQKAPILGLCLGVQLLTGGSDEGKEKGLGWVNGRTVAFDKNKLTADYKIPHMGWTDVSRYEKSKLFTGMYEEPRFYFVHSYHLVLDDPANTIAYANYGYDFAAGVEFNNILGVQFHPEKSHKFGMKLLENFIKFY